ncbi:MAG: hypothetical protein M3P95_02365, partial [Actinomycetota bacterium]|nr:hypothetical protein [Actinomycetota bacterium]
PAAAAAALAARRASGATAGTGGPAHDGDAARKAARIGLGAVGLAVTGVAAYAGKSIRDIVKADR